MKFQINNNGFLTDLGYDTLNISTNQKVGFTPIQLLVSSIASCSGIALQEVLAQKGITYEDLKVKTDVERNSNEVNKVEKIHILFLIISNNIDDKQIEQSIEIAKRNCATVQSIKSSIDVIETFELSHSE